ncbi:laccase 1, partial [Elysia marginata]
KGRHAEFEDGGGSFHYTPYAEFKVTAGERYRFRLISNGIMNCPIQFSIDDHTMTVIASDGHPILPFVVDSIVVNSGERYDFVLNADHSSPLRNFWIRLHGYNNCALHKATQTAILKYDGAPDVLPPEPTTWEDAVRPGFDQFCNIDTLAPKNCKEEWCACTHHYKVKRGHLVELIIVDEGILSHAYHPMHLHGHKFSVVAMGRIGEQTTVDEVKALDLAGGITRRIPQAPIKDTVIVPDGGYTVIRFKADNPGVWLFHCHVELHAAMGMAMVFQVGEAKDFPRAPRNFQRCGNS